MNTINNNKEILKNWRQTYPESFKDFTFEEPFLILGNKKIDMSTYELSDLMMNNPLFVDQLSTLSPNDVYNILNLHVMLLSSSSKIKGGSNPDAKDDNKDKLGKLQVFDPVMKNVSMFKKKTENGFVEYFSITDVTGNTHIFYNDRNVELIRLYSTIKLEGKNVTPGSLIDTFRRYLHEVPLTSSYNLIDNSQVSENFTNKMRSLETNYKGNSSVRILGNAEHDISVVENQSHPEETIINTYRRNEYGDLIAESHGNNLSSEKKLNQEEPEEDDQKNKNNDTQEQIVTESKVLLVSFDEFNRRIDSELSLTQEQTEEMNLWYSILGDILTYIDLVDPQVKHYYDAFKNKVEIISMNADETGHLTENQQIALEKYQEIYDKRFSTKDKENTERLENARKLTLQLDNAGNIDFIQIIWIAMGFMTILTAIAIYLIS